MRILLAYDALDDATKQIVSILSDTLKDKNWRLDTYDVEEVSANDIALSQLMVIGGTTSTAVWGDNIVSVSPNLLDFLNALDEIDLREKYATSFATRPTKELSGRGAAGYIQDRLIDAGAQILMEGRSFEVGEDGVVGIGDIKRCESFGNDIRKKFLGQMVSLYGENLPSRVNIEKTIR
jgi:hypothetical protein